MAPPKNKEKVGNVNTRIPVSKLSIIRKRCKAMKTTPTERVRALLYADAGIEEEVAA